MPDIDENILRKARSGDKDAVLSVLTDHYRVDADIMGHIVRLYGRGRQRDPVAYENLVAARKYSEKRRWLGISNQIRIQEVMSRFGLKRNIATYVVEGQSYPAVRKEAERQLQAEAEADETKIKF